MRGADIVRNVYEAYKKRDIEGALAHCADDVVFRWIADEERSHHAGVTSGKQEFLARLVALDHQFEYRRFEPGEIIDGGDKVAAQVELHLTRRTTGKEFVMRAANFWTIQDGKIVKMVEYYDTALAASVI